MKKGNVFLITSALALVASQNVIADNRAGAFTITPEVGYYWYAGKRNLNNVAAVPAFALAYNFTKNWGIEFAYATTNTRYSSSAGYTGHVTGNLYTLDGVYHFNTIDPWQMVSPYIDLGVGVLDLNPNGTSATNQGNINGAIGAQLFFSDSVAVRPEIRDLYTISGGKNDIMADLGVSFLIGGHQPETVLFKDKDGDM